MHITTNDIATERSRGISVIVDVNDKDKLPLPLSNSRLSKTHSSTIKDIDKDTQLEICT
jgi:hypothetical protein